MRSASREEGLELSDRACATGQKARSPGHSFTELNDFKSPVVPKLYFWIVSACTQFGSVEKEMTQKCNPGRRLRKRTPRILDLSCRFFMAPGLDEASCVFLLKFSSLFVSWLICDFLYTEGRAWGKPGEEPRCPSRSLTVPSQSSRLSA